MFVTGTLDPNGRIVIVLETEFDRLNLISALENIDRDNTSYDTDHLAETLVSDLCDHCCCSNHNAERAEDYQDEHATPAQPTRQLFARS